MISLLPERDELSKIIVGSDKDMEAVVLSINFYRRLAEKSGEKIEVIVRQYKDDDTGEWGPKGGSS